MLNIKALNHVKALLNPLTWEHIIRIRNEKATLYFNFLHIFYILLVIINKVASQWVMTDKDLIGQKVLTIRLLIAW